MKDYEDDLAFLNALGERDLGSFQREHGPLDEEEQAIFMVGWSTGGQTCFNRMLENIRRNKTQRRIGAPMSNYGGARPGAGRKKLSRNKTAHIVIDKTDIAALNFLKKVLAADPNDPEYEIIKYFSDPELGAERFYRGYEMSRAWEKENPIKGEL